MWKGSNFSWLSASYILLFLLWPCLVSFSADIVLVHLYFCDTYVSFDLYISIAHFAPGVLYSVYENVSHC